MILEGDSRSVINKIQSTDEDLSNIEALTWEAKELLKTFQRSCFSYIGRSNNNAVHVMTRFRLTRIEDCYGLKRC